MTALPHSLRIKNIAGLISTILSLDSPLLERVERKHNQQYSAFHTTLSFLVKIGIIKIKGKALSIDGDVVNGMTVNQLKNEEHLGLQIIDRLLSAKTPYNRNVRKFLLLFQRLNKHLAMRRNELDIEEFAAVRDLFLDVGLIERHNESLVIARNYEDLVQAFVEITSPGGNLKERLIAQDELGRRAEGIVLDYELDRLSISHDKVVGWPGKTPLISA